MSVRDTIYGLLDAAMADGVNVYRTPAEQVKGPAVIVGTMGWTPDRMTSLARLEWTVTIPILTPISKTAYSIPDLEDLSLEVAQALLAENIRVVGFETDGTVTDGGVDYLGGTLEAIYKENT